MPSIFGAERYLKGRIFAPLTPAVALADKLVEKGHDVYFYGSKDIKTKAKVISGDSRLTDSDPFYYQFRYRDPQEQRYSTPEIIKRDFEYDLTMQAYKDALDKKLDIIHSYHDFGSHYFNELTNFPTVYTLHDPLPQREDTIEYLRFSKFPNHNYISISNSQRRGKVNLNFVATIYHGIDLGDYEFNSEPGDHLIYFGRILEDKGLDIAIKVALSLGIPLHVATSSVRANKSAEYYDKKIAPFIDGRNVILDGFILGEEKSDFIKKGKAFIFPLRWEEPFGLTLIESMACGTPVIAYNRGSVSELVRDGVTGFVIEPEDSQNESKFVIKKKGEEGLEEAVKRIKEIDRMACRRHIEDNFAIEKMTEGYEGVYKKILGAT